jgi:hypothetical protein
VHYQRDHRKDQKDMDEKAADVKHEKSTEPKEDQNDRQDEEHDCATLCEMSADQMQPGAGAD